NEITKEIRTVQHQNVDDTKQVLGDTFTPLERFAFKSPMFLKKFLLYLLKYLPLLKKKHMGTIGVTAVGMKGSFPGWIVSSGGPPTMLFIISGINKKPGVRNDKVVIRDYLQLTISFDHDIIDGGPMARFLEDFLSLCEQTYGLKEKEKTTTSSTT
ncbi:MAG: 2-oxo acid dehydrogenase subunit E2, partial [Candidatus Heimdallarchaeota archaeon]|nr:2-oxo acid dehydrogenase subunit E2 [Candidatus Heimdallarchaeota archaeon]